MTQGLSTVGRADMLCRSIKRSIDMHQSALCALRLTVRSTDRELCSLVGKNGRPVGRPLSPTVKNPTVGGRPAGRPTEEFSFVFFSNDYILFCLFLGLFPTALLGFLLMFSSPINSGNVENLKNKIFKV